MGNQSIKDSSTRASPNLKSRRSISKPFLNLSGSHTESPLISTSSLATTHTNVDEISIHSQGNINILTIEEEKKYLSYLTCHHEKTKYIILFCFFFLLLLLSIHFYFDRCHEKNVLLVINRNYFQVHFVQHLVEHLHIFNLNKIIMEILIV